MTSLSMDQAPPIDAPFRFFLTAPFFFVAIAMLLLHAGTHVWESRWSGTLLAVTHLLTLGFLSMTMTGALLQMLPVVVGVPVPRVQGVARMIHLPWLLGTVCLALGLYGWGDFLLRAGIGLLSVAIGFFLLVGTYSLVRAPTRHATVLSMAYALLSFLFTFILGIALAGSLSGNLHLELTSFIPLHQAWGLVGWMGGLIMGISYQVVPMFLLTPAYPARITRWLGGTLWGLLGAWSVTSWMSFAGSAGWHILFGLMIALGLSLFVMVTLWLQHKRRRKIFDTTQQFWRIGLFSLLLACGVWSFVQTAPAWLHSAILLGILFLYGFVAALVQGMLYKIIPFLVWFHLQSRLPKGHFAPNMKQLIPDRHARRQMLVYLGSLLGLLSSLVWPVLIYPSALAVGVSGLLLWWNLVGAARQYRTCCALAISS